MDKEDGKVKHSKAHDQFYREAMSNKQVAKEFFSSILPKNILDIVDLETIKAEKDTFVDPSLGVGASDALFSVKYGKGDKQEEGYIYLLGEHQSTSDHFMALRLLKYMIMIWEAYRAKEPKSKHLPLIYAVVYYSGKAKYRAPLKFFELFTNPELAERCFSDPYKLVDLHRTADEKIKETVWLAVMMFIMKHIKARDIIPYLLEIKPMLMAIGEVNYLYIEAVFRYIIKKAEAEQIDKVIEVFSNIVEEEEREKLMTIADKLIQKGVKQGIEIGIQQGRQEGRQEGREQGIELTALNMLKKGHAIEIIIEATGLPKERVMQLAASLTKH